MTRGPDEILLGFGRALRAAGVPVTQDRAHGFLAAVATLGLDDQRATYLAGRATLCAGPDDLERYDQVFEAYFNGRDGLPASAHRGDDPQRRGRACPRPRTAPAQATSPRTWSRRWPARRRCCGTATWPG